MLWPCIAETHNDTLCPHLVDELGKAGPRARLIRRPHRVHFAVEWMTGAVRSVARVSTNGETG